jgi:hypothetical protein
VPVRQKKEFEVQQRVFQQGERVTWRDASGERQRGRVLQHSPKPDPGGTEQGEVLVMREGSSHVSALPPECLALAEPGG